MSEFNHTHDKSYLVSSCEAPAYAKIRTTKAKQKLQLDYFFAREKKPSSKALRLMFHAHNSLKYIKHMKKPISRNSSMIEANHKVVKITNFLKDLSFYDFIISTEMIDQQMIEVTNDEINYTIKLLKRINQKHH